MVNGIKNQQLRQNVALGHVEAVRRTGGLAEFFSASN